MKDDNASPNNLAAEYDGLRLKQKEFFLSGATRPASFRIQMLIRLKEAVKRREKEINGALCADLRKSEFEAYSSEIGIIYAEINYAIKHLHRWMKRKCVIPEKYLWPSVGYIIKEPYGVALIISPWNYPFQLLFSPLIGAIAAGNTAILKPSEYAPYTSEVMAKIIESAFEENYIKVIPGAVAETTALLELPFDYLFFTGSVPVGKIVMAAAAKHLTPLTLELGGKSPAIIDKEVNLKISARKIVWGKFFNSGQTCIAPDYILVHEDIKDALISEIKQTLQHFYGANPQESVHYSRIVNTRHFDRLLRLLDPSKIVAGGKADRTDLYIEPTIVDKVSWDDAIMADEIFGPILPVLTYRTIDEAIADVRKLPKPLSLYVFSKSSSFQEKVVNSIPFGGGCINATILHFASLRLPFGGVGPSGIGSYHGKASFDTFSHSKSILKQPASFDTGETYPPKPIGLKLLRFFMK
jgi:aldehyde dehydrogenase (NAD+)